MPVVENASAFSSPCHVASRFSPANVAQFAPALLLREERLCFSELYRHQIIQLCLISAIGTLQLVVTKAVSLQQRCAPLKAVFMPNRNNGAQATLGASRLYAITSRCPFGAIASGAALHAITALGV
jgi:hypothetical protein